MHWTDGPLGFVLGAVCSAALFLAARKAYPNDKQYAHTAGAACAVVAIGLGFLNLDLGMKWLLTVFGAGVVGLVRKENWRWSLALLLAAPFLLGLWFTLDPWSLDPASWLDGPMGPVLACACAAVMFLIAKRALPRIRQHVNAVGAACAALSIGLYFVDPFLSLTWLFPVFGAGVVGLGREEDPQRSLALLIGAVVLLGLWYGMAAWALSSI